MNIYNKPGKVVIIVEEYNIGLLPPAEDSPIIDTTNVIGMEYLIYQYDTAGCLFATPVTSGIISLEDATAEINLPDGKYYVEVSLLNAEQISTEPIAKNFYVIYNRLPELTKELKEVFCSVSCKDCKELTVEKLLKVFFNIILFLNCINLIEDLPAFKKLNCKYNEILASACEKGKFYGKFNFDYKNILLELLATCIIEIYNREISQLRESNLDINNIKSLFKVDSLKLCMYDSNIIFEDVLNTIKQINCECHE